MICTLTTYMGVNVQLARRRERRGGPVLPFNAQFLP